MQSAFLSGEDIHRVTASQVFNVPLEEVTPLQRSRAKAVNFGIVYGISAFSLAQDIGVWQNEAKEYIDAYLDNTTACAIIWRGLCRTPSATALSPRCSIAAGFCRS